MPQSRLGQRWGLEPGERPPHGIPQLSTPCPLTDTVPLSGGQSGEGLRVRDDTDDDRAWQPDGPGMLVNTITGPPTGDNVPSDQLLRLEITATRRIAG
jgi:hypothetical protein